MVEKSPLAPGLRWVWRTPAQQSHGARLVKEAPVNLGLAVSQLVQTAVGLSESLRRGREEARGLRGRVWITPTLEDWWREGGSGVEAGKVSEADTESRDGPREEEGGWKAGSEVGAPVNWENHMLGLAALGWLRV